jgi:hypothetical protein
VSSAVATNTLAIGIDHEVDVRGGSGVAVVGARKRSREHVLDPGAVELAHDPGQRVLAGHELRRP